MAYTRSGMTSVPYREYRAPLSAVIALVAMYVYDSSATGRFLEHYYMKRFFTRCMVCPRVSVRSAVCQKNSRKGSIKHNLMNTCARCVMCLRMFVLLYGRRTTEKVPSSIIL